MSVFPPSHTALLAFMWQQLVKPSCSHTWMTFTIRSLTKSILLKKAVKDDAVVYFHHKNESDNFINHWSWQGHSDRCWWVFAWLSFITWLTSDILPETSLTAFLLTSALVNTACPNTFDHLRYRGFEWQSCRAVFKLLQFSSQCSVWPNDGWVL